MSSSGGGGQGKVRPIQTGRMPQAPASLLVQLPPDELKRYAKDPHALNALYSAGPSSSSSSTYGKRFGYGGQKSSQVQPSDVAVLAASLQERRKREAHIFVWQQHLIASGASGGPNERPTAIIDRSLLKRALTQLSLPAWLQVLQERHLAQRCAYPTCNRTPVKPHLSRQRSAAAIPLDAPRYRISLRRKVIERDERDDAGGQNSFCSNTCWRRGEWVSRWVLNGGRSTRQAQRQVSDESFGSAIRDDNVGLGDEVDQGGRWERIMNEEHWTEIELLEDLEEKGEVDRLSDDEQATPRTANDKIMSAVLVNAPHSNGTSDADQQKDDVLRGQATAVARARGQQRKQSKGTAQGFLDMLDSLVIKERTEAEQAAASTEAATRVHIKLPHERDDVLGELGMRGAVDGAPSLATTIKRSARRAIQEDDEGDVSMSDDVDEDEDDDVVEDGISGRKSEPHGKLGLTQEKQKQRKEEDDLFEQAWQAMNEEKANGTWQDD